MASAEVLHRDKWELMGIDELSRQLAHANVREVLTEVAYTDKWYQQEVLSSARGDLLSNRHVNSLIPPLLARLAIVRLARLIPRFRESKTSANGPIAMMRTRRTSEVLVNSLGKKFSP